MVFGATRGMPERPPSPEEQQDIDLVARMMTEATLTDIQDKARRMIQQYGFTGDIEAAKTAVGQSLKEEGSIPIVRLPPTRISRSTTMLSYQHEAAGPITELQPNNDDERGDLRSWTANNVQNVHPEKESTAGSPLTATMGAFDYESFSSRDVSSYTASREFVGILGTFYVEGWVEILQGTSAKS